MQLPHVGSAPRPPLDILCCANTMAACIVGTRLDYCYALLCGATEKSLNKLQIVQKKLAEVVCNVTNVSSTPLFSSLIVCIGFPSEVALCWRSPPCATKHPGSINQVVCSTHWSHTCHAVDWDLLRWTCWQYQGHVAKQWHAVSLLQRQQFATDFHCSSITLTFKSHLKTHLFVVTF